MTGREPSSVQILGSTAALVLTMIGQRYAGGGSGGLVLVLLGLGGMAFILDMGP